MSDRYRDRAWAVLLAILFMALPAKATPAAGSVPSFKIETGPMELSRPARPQAPFDKVGRRFAVLGFESGSFEAWAYPLKLIRQFELSFLLGSSTVPIQARDIVRSISVQPAVTTLTFTYQSFAVKAHFVAPLDEPGSVILLDVRATEPLDIIASFFPVLQPMWPAGLGGQYATWDEGLKAYLISEPTRRNHGFIGSPAAQGMSYTPAHMLSDTPNQFRISVADPGAVAGRFIPIVISGGKGRRDEVRKTYEDIVADPERRYRLAIEHYEKLMGSSLVVRTPDPVLDSAFSWAKVALEGLFVDNPDLGRGLVAGLGASGTGGRPGFGWFFGTDAYLNSLSLNGLGMTDLSREALAFTQKWQRKDGKMAHELSQAAGYLRWWEDYPYGYIHGDTTPYYVVAVDDYVRATGDLAFLKASWPSLVKAFEWSAATDADGDGLMDNSKAGLGALEFGSLTGIQTDVYLAAVWAKAARVMERLAVAVGDKVVARRAGEAAGRAEKAWNEKFWDEALGQYSYAFNKDGRRVPELTPWSAVGLAWGLGEPERGISTLARMNAADLTTDWGVRMLSEKSPLFEPLNYNYGAVWPFLTGWVATALFRGDFLSQGHHVLAANARHTFDNALGAVMELYSGALNTWPQEGVSHQGFSSTGVVLPFVRGLLGLEGDALARTAAFRPALPPDWTSVAVERWRIGTAELALDYVRTKDRVTLKVRAEGATGFRFAFEPALGLGTEVLGASVNGDAVQAGEGGRGATASLRQAVRPRVVFPLTGRDEVEVRFVPAPEVLPPEIRSSTGDPSRGLRIIRTELRGQALEVGLEGLSGEVYELGLSNADRVASVSGAEFDGQKLRVAFPASNPGSYVRADVLVRLKDRAIS